MTQLLERMLSVGVVEGATRTQKHHVENDGGSFKTRTEIFQHSLPAILMQATE
jgi:hypothetical protein